MKTIGLTGGIGSGKSTVSKIFKTLGVPVFNTDLEARKLFSDYEVKNEIVQQFGKEVFVNNTFDRSKMAALVFNNKSALEKLNAIVHPRVAKQFEKWASTHSKLDYIIKESAIIFEYNIDKSLDSTILVLAPIEVRIRRVMQRDNMPEQSIRDRINNQMPDQEKIKRASYIINNNNQMLIPQVIEINSNIKKQK